MSAPIKITPAGKVQRGEGTSYVIDNYITKDHTDQVSIAISHLNGRLGPTLNIESDRVYYFLSGHALFTLSEGPAIEAKAGDMVLIPKGIRYQVEGVFASVLINAPPFRLENESL